MINTLINTKENKKQFFAKRLLSRTRKTQSDLRTARKKLIPFFIGVLMILIPIFYLSLRSSTNVEAATMSLTTTASTVQIDVPNRYRMVMNTGDTVDYILFYDRYQSDGSPVATHEFFGPVLLIHYATTAFEKQLSSKRPQPE